MQKNTKTIAKKPKHIVITGASSGIGKALAVHYAESFRNASPLILSLSGRHQERLESVAQECRKIGAEVRTALVDVTDSHAVEQWLLEQDRYAPVDIVIANAGISMGTGKKGNQGRETIENVRDIFKTNVDGVFNTIYPLIPPMIERGVGQIVIMSSLAGFRGWPTAPAYCASKAAVKVYGEALRGSLAEQGIAVNVVCPGFIKSPMTDANNFPMPFLISAQRAAAIIVNGLDRNKARIVFPWPMYCLIWIISFLPDVVIRVLLERSNNKNSIRPVAKVA